MGNGTLPHPDTGKGIALLANTSPPEYWHPTSRSRRSQVYLRPATTIRLSDFRSALPHCFLVDGPDDGASEWQRKRKGKGFVRPMTTDWVPMSRSTREFCGLQKP